MLVTSISCLINYLGKDSGIFNSETPRALMLHVVYIFVYSLGRVNTF